MKFVEFISNAHLNSKNIAVYEDKKNYKVVFENIVTDEHYGYKNFETMEDVEDWYDAFPGSGLGKLSNAMDALSE